MNVMFESNYDRIETSGMVRNFLRVALLFESNYDRIETTDKGKGWDYKNTFESNYDRIETL